MVRALPQGDARLDKLQETLGGQDFEVVAINIDTRDPEKPKTFLKKLGSPSWPISMTRRPRSFRS
jgi:cytochrome oxidase Cu insertion factor (SCO1/SenC/PrrC family)